MKQGQFFYSIFVAIVSCIAMLSGNSLFGIKGLLIMGFGIVIFILAYFRWELYEMQAKKSK